MKLNITKQEAQEFLNRQAAGDIIGLKYLYAVLKDCHHNDPVCRVVRAAWDLNDYITLTEMGEATYYPYIDEAYRNLMMELVEGAQEIIETDEEGGI